MLIPKRFVSFRKNEQIQRVMVSFHCHTTWIFSKVFLCAAAVCTMNACSQSGVKLPSGNSEKPAAVHKTVKEKSSDMLDTAAYTKAVVALANGDTTGKWPVKGIPFPKKGCILPYKRIVAYYGNLYSSKMGVLGEYPPDILWMKLHREVKAWEAADPSTPVQSAIHYIAVVAQGSPGRDGKYRSRMPASQIDSVLSIARMGDAIVFLDVQVALSDVKDEVPLLEKYLVMPQVHLAIDPEFSMKDGSLPGKKIGTMNARDVNFCSEYLSKLVKRDNLPPKILIVHRFTQGMVTDYRKIKIHPEVQIVMNMDGWGAPVLKLDTYKQYIYKEPVQFTGFKLFYKNDLKKPPHTMLTPEQIVALRPKPIYIQYQ